MSIYLYLGSLFGRCVQSVGDQAQKFVLEPRVARAASPRAGEFVWRECHLCPNFAILGHTWVTGKSINYAAAAALQLMLAQQADLTPGELIWVGGDVRLTRRPDSIYRYKITDFEVEGYELRHAAIKADVAVCTCR